MGWAGGHRAPSTHWSPLKLHAALQPNVRCEYYRNSYVDVPQHRLFSGEKDSIVSVLTGETLQEKETEAEARLHTSLADP